MEHFEQYINENLQDFEKKLAIKFDLMEKDVTSPD